MQSILLTNVGKTQFKETTRLMNVFVETNSFLLNFSFTYGDTNFLGSILYSLCLLGSD